MMAFSKPVLAAVAVAAVVIAASCTYTGLVSNSGGEEEVYGIIGALDVEVKDLLSEMDEEYSETVSGMTFHVGELRGKNVVVVKSGMGKVFSSMCAQTLILRYGVTSIINTGVAGTLSADVGIGDLVVSSETVQHDYEVVELGFEPGFIPEIGLLAIPADPTLRDKAVTAISDVSAGTKVFTGRICTGDMFVSGDESERIIELFGGLCCEMEGGAIAQVCYVNHVPFVIIRCISDDVNGTTPEDYAKFETEMAHLCANMTMDMLATL